MLLVCVCVCGGHRRCNGVPCPMYGRGHICGCLSGYGSLPATATATTWLPPLAPTPVTALRMPVQPYLGQSNFTKTQTAINLRRAMREARERRKVKVQGLEDSCAALGGKTEHVRPSRPSGNVGRATKLRSAAAPTPNTISAPGCVRSLRTLTWWWFVLTARPENR